MASPVASARAVRPMRCTYSSGVPGTVKIHDVRDTVHIQTTRRDIGRYQNFDAATAKTTQGLCARSLAFAPCNTATRRPSCVKWRVKRSARTLVRVNTSTCACAHTLVG
jgi:hypothetical protein